MTELGLAPEGAKRCVSEAAFHRADELVAKQDSGHYRNALARLIQDVSDAAKEACGLATNAPFSGAVVRSRLTPFVLPEPVDPLVIEAREIAARHMEKCGDFPPERVELTRAGGRDEERDVRAIIDAVKRGVELAKAGDA